ncbi:MAG: carboxylating nicotinate-nucleotide diphosphorylase, partial [Nitrospinota bacterium]
ARKDGENICSGANIISVAGPLSSLLTAERTALNFLQHLSGVATMTSKFVKKIEGTSAVIIDTRKTTPGWRSLEKKAVLQGGGENHRFGLYDRFLIKDNHIKGAGGITSAVEKCREAGLDLKIEVETESMSQVKEAVEAGADIIMLDNMSVEAMKEAVSFIGGRSKVEASGNVTLANVREIAETGVDYISIGAITHSAPAVDISMKIL